jgi:CheY-like chemotaxis protein
VSVNTPSALGHVIGLAPDQLTYRILVVEDRWENQQVLVQLLESVGFEVDVASNGQEAIAVWQSDNPHLICMDLQMPVMDGYAATQHIKHQATQAQLPAPIIIGITANTFEETRLETVRVDFDDFIQKPVQAEELFEVIFKHLRVSYLREPSHHSAGHLPQIEPNVQPSILTPKNFQTFSPEWLDQVYLAAIELDESQLVELIHQIHEEYPEIANALLSLVESLEFEKIIDLVYKSPE